MKLNVFLTVCLALFLSANAWSQSEESTFGETFEAKKVMKYDKFVKKIAKKSSIEEVVLKGKVEAVCQMKGCWMNIVSDKNQDNGTMVKFKDYGFFVPKDISGRTVIMKGKAYTEVTSVDELKHLAEDAGKSKDEIAAITAPKEEVKFLATGVILLPNE